MMVLRDTPQTSFFGPEVRRSLQLNINNVQSHGKSVNPLLKNILPGIDFTFNKLLYFQPHYFSGLFYISIHP